MQMIWRMGFRQRWALVIAAAVTFIIVFFGFNPNELKCRCAAKCRNLRPAGRSCKCDPTANPNADLVGPPVPQEDNPPQELQLEGWILDCITWDKKWEMVELEADPHEIVVDDKFREGETAVRRKQLFQDIYDGHTWEGEDRDKHYNGPQVSGPGAWLRNAQGMLATLHTVVNHIKEVSGQATVSVLDLGCGDLQWMSRFLVTREDVTYTGVDIVSPLITSHHRQFDSLPSSTFIEADTVVTALNNSYDIVICRDIFQYMVQSDVLTTLVHISASGSHYLLATNFPDTTKNGDDPSIGVERFFPYNLELPPYLLEPPICSSYDWHVEHITLWALPVRQKYEY